MLVFLSIAISWIVAVFFAGRFIIALNNKPAVWVYKRYRKVKKVLYSTYYKNHRVSVYRIGRRDVNVYVDDMLQATKDTVQSAKAYALVYVDSIESSYL
jgi:hypothetical protein